MGVGTFFIRLSQRFAFLSMTKALTSTEKIPKTNVATKELHQNFDYTKIADRLRTFSLGDGSNPTGMVKPVYGIPIFPLTAKVQKDTPLKFVNNPHA